MRRNLGLISGASAAAIAVVVVSQAGWFTRGPNEAAAPPAEAQPTAVAAPEAAPLQPASSEPVPTPEPVPAAAPDPSPALRAEITRLAAVLAEREAAYATLAAGLSGRETEVGRLTALLADRDTELAALRAEIDALRALSEFDAQLMAMKSGGDPGGARLEPARAEQAAPDAAFDADKPPAPPLAAQPLTAIHFDPSSSRLSPGGRAHAAAAAVTLADMPIARIRVIGYTDRVGGPARNRALAQARARAVADFLIAAGLSGAMIEIAAMGESDVPVTTDDGVAEPLNRCAEIVVTPL